MTTPYRKPPLRPRAIELMKAGQTADAVHAELVSEGEDPEEVRAVVTELVAFQRQAAAMDPTRLRAEAQSMFWRGASLDDVVAHFVGVGIVEEHARPEAERILVAVRRLKMCQRCGAPTNPEEITFDPSGFSICSACTLQDEVALSEERGFLRDAEWMGRGRTLAQPLGSSIGRTSRPFCAACRLPTGVHVSRLDAVTRTRVDPTCEWACCRCWQRIL